MKRSTQILQAALESANQEDVNAVSQEGAFGAGAGAVAGGVAGFSAAGPAGAYLGALVGTVVGSGIGELVSWGATKLLTKETQLAMAIHREKTSVVHNQHMVGEYEHALKLAKSGGHSAEEISMAVEDLTHIRQDLEDSKKRLAEAEKALAKIREAKIQALKIAHKGIESVGLEDDTAPDPDAINDDAVAAPAPAAEEVPAPAPAEGGEAAPQSNEAPAASVVVNVTAGDNTQIDVNGDAAAAAADLAEGENQVAEADDAVDQLQDAAQSLEAFYASLEAYQANGGLAPEARQMAQVAFASILAPLDLEAPALPSMEAFGGTSSRRQATQVSMESAGEVWEKVWNAIKLAFSKVKEFIIAFFKRIINAAERLKHNAQKLKDAASKSGTTAKAGQYTVPKSALKYLIAGNPSKKPETAMDTMAKVVADCSNYDDAVAKNVTEVLNDIQSFASNPTDNALSDKIANLLLVTNAPQVFRNRKNITSDNDTTVEQATTDLLPGGKRFYITSVPGNAAQKVLSAIKVNPFRVGSDSDESALSAVPEEYNLATPSIKEIESIAESAIKLADAILATKKVSDDNTALAKKVADYKPNYSGNLLEKGQQYATLKAMTMLFQGRGAACGKATASVTAHASQVGLSMVVIAAAALKQYGTDTAMVAAPAPAAAEPAAA